jgi:hypothetical protein
LRSLAIAPQSFARLIFPPIRPTIQQTGPTFGIGVGTYVGDRRNGRDAFDDELIDCSPQYFDVVDDSALYWSWSGEGEIRLMLVFSRKDENFTQDFTIRRIKL